METREGESSRNPNGGELVASEAAELGGSGAWARVQARSRAGGRRLEQERKGVGEEATIRRAAPVRMFRPEDFRSYPGPTDLLDSFLITIATTASGR